MSRKRNAALDKQTRFSSTDELCAQLRTTQFVPDTMHIALTRLWCVSAVMVPKIWQMTRGEH